MELCSVAEFAALLAPHHHQLAALLQHNPSVSVGVVNLQYEGNVLATQVIVLHIQYDNNAAFAGSDISSACILPPCTKGLSLQTKHSLLEKTKR